MKKRKYCVHLSREQAEAVTKSENTVLISITDPGSTGARIQPGAWLEVLPLQFHDVGHGEINTQRLIEAGYVPPLPEHAQAIAEFIRKHAGCNIVAHCEAGISRSAAVCAVLRELGWRYLKPHATGLTHANPLLLGLLQRAWDNYDRNAIQSSHGSRAHA